MKRCRIKNGFTLLEAILTLGMISILIAVIIMAFIISLRIFSTELSESSIKFDAQKGIERMTEELRGALEIVSSESSSVGFWWKDLNANASRESDETVTFSWDGTPGSTLQRAQGTDKSKIIYNVNNLLFTYQYPGDIEVITISLTVAKENVISTMESSVRLRNL